MLRGCSQERKSSDGDSSLSCSNSRRSSSQLLAMGGMEHDVGKSWYLEQQIISLTRDKKQLMTHLHWLSRQRAEQSRHDYMRKNVSNEAKNVSLEEGTGAKFESFLARFSRSGEFLSGENRSEVEDEAAGVQTTCGVGNSQDDSENDESDIVMGMVRDQNVEKQLTEMKITEVQCKEKNLVAKLKRLKATMLSVKEIVVKNNEACNRIFQLSFQNIKHPKEPKCYSMWSSYDEEDTSSLVKSQESLNCFMTSGYRSLDYYAGLQKDEVSFPYECHGILQKKKKTSISSPELFIRGKDGLNQYSSSLSSFEMMNRDQPPLSRSLSGKEAKFMLSEGRCSESLPLSRGSEKACLSASGTENDLRSFNCNTHLTHYQTSPLHFSLVEHAARRPEHYGSDDSSQVSSNISSPSTKDFPENLIS